MIRVVLDTNILISALLQPQGLPARTFVLVLAETTAQLCVSGDVYAEYEEVIRRPKFNRSEMIIDHALRAVRQNGFWVKPSERVHACSDPDDDIFLECAHRSESRRQQRVDMWPRRKESFPFWRRFDARPGKPSPASQRDGCLARKVWKERNPGRSCSGWIPIYSFRRA
jgi:uncharacterized protein